MRDNVKKIVLAAVAAVVMSAGAEAANSVKNFVKSNDQAGGVIDNEVIYIYMNQKIGKEKDASSLEILKRIAQEKICGMSDTRDIVGVLGMSVKFIYLYQGDVTIVKIDNCKGTKLKEEK